MPATPGVWPLLASPWASETGEHDRRGQHLSEAGSSLVPTTLVVLPTPPASSDVAE
ncbi:MAG: hypothetical protein ACRDZ9_01255 [Acidimicrobiales bacterium]